MSETLATDLLHALKSRGAKNIFGIPGDFVLPFFRVIEDSNILPFYTLSHEPGVGYAADASARISSTLGVAVITYGAGALNNPSALKTSMRWPKSPTPMAAPLSSTDAALPKMRGSSISAKTGSRTAPSPTS